MTSVGFSEASPIMFICIYNFKPTVMVPFKLYANVQFMYDLYITYYNRMK